MQHPQHWCRDAWEPRIAGLPACLAPAPPCGAWADHMTISLASGAVWSGITRSLGEEEISASELMIRSPITSPRSRFRICAFAAGLQAAGGRGGGRKLGRWGESCVAGSESAWRYRTWYALAAGIPHPASRILVSHPSWVSDVCRANKVAVRRRRYLASASEERMRDLAAPGEHGFGFPVPIMTYDVFKASRT